MMAVIGGGSFATALVHVLAEHHHPVYWWIRDVEQAAHIRRYRQNPKYLSDVYVPEHVHPVNDFSELFAQSSVYFLAIPSAFFIQSLNTNLPKDGIFVSGIKGLVGKDYLTVSACLQKDYQIPSDNIAVISGPTHAEEIVQHQLSQLTVAASHYTLAQTVSAYLNRSFLQTVCSTDIEGIEYVGAIKNIMAIGMGVLNGLGYGDNFKAVYLSKAVQETVGLLQVLCPSNDRNILNSVYLGDLLVTCYSQFSRNRMFGNMLGKGYSVRSAQLEMNMVAEGYYALQGIAVRLGNRLAEFPICYRLYQGIYKQHSIRKLFSEWSGD